VHVRNTGDDALAIWAKGTSTGNRFKFATVRVPYHASAIAIYGGADNGVEDCDVADTVRNGAGVQVGTRHDPVPFAGITQILRTTLARTSSIDTPNPGCFGAVWIFADTKVIDAPLSFQDLEVYDSSCDAILINGSFAAQQLTFDRITVQKTGGSGIHIATSGNATMNSVVVTETALEPAVIPPEFNVLRGDGNQGW
jgi:hypothetical protein